MKRISFAGDRPKHFDEVLRRARNLMLEVIEAPRSLPILDANDYRKLDFYIQHYWQQHNQLAKDTSEVVTANRFGRQNGRQKETHNVEILGPRIWQRYEDRELVAQGVNPLGVVPVVHIQNMPLPLRYEGQGDVEPLIPLQDELNTRLSDRASRITFQSFKMFLGKGIEGFEDRAVAPGRMWSTENPEAAIEEFDGDLKNLQAKSTDVSDTINISGNLGKVKLNDLENCTIRSGGNIGKVQFNNIENALLSAKYDIDLVKSKTNIQNTKILAGYDIGPDCLPGTGDEYFNTSGATIKAVIVGKKGNFDGSFALAGVKPLTGDVVNDIIAPNPEDQVLANYGIIERAKLGRVLSGDPVNGIYGLFAATEIGKVKYQEIFGQNAPDFEIRSLW